MKVDKKKMSEKKLKHRVDQETLSTIANVMKAQDETTRRVQWLLRMLAELEKAELTLRLPGQACDDEEG